MSLFFRLLSLSPKLARAFRDFSIGFVAWAHADLDAIKNWFVSSPPVQVQMLEQQPALNEKIEALFVIFQSQIQTQHDVVTLRREMLNFPALPEEGY